MRRKSAPVFVIKITGDSGIFAIAIITRDNFQFLKHLHQLLLFFLSVDFHMCSDSRNLFPA